MAVSRTGHIETQWIPDLRKLDAEPQYALTRRFWAQRMMEVIAREEAIDVWGTLLPTRNIPVGQRASYEKTTLGLSAFFGKSLYDMTRLFDEMEEDCRAFVQKDITLDATSSEYSVPGICKCIIRFTMSKGFGPPPTGQNVFFDMMNHFPHAYLTTNRLTLPIALIHIFVSLGRRLGLDASPINFPEKVLAHVRSHREREEPYYINAYVRDASECIISRGDLGLHLSNPDILIPTHLSPAAPSIMLLRAARNILISYSHASRLSYDMAQGCLYLAMVVHLMFHGDVEGVAQILRTVDLLPIDCSTFLMDKLAPILPPPSRMLLELHCKTALEQEAVESEKVQVRSRFEPVRYCVGLPFKHRRYGYIACIVRWDEVCKASDSWINQMRVDDLDFGRHQPFYTSLVLDEHATQRYIAEENIIPIPLPEGYIDEFFEKHPNMAMYFQGVEFEDSPEPEKRWRMVLSPESRAHYPEDDAYGSAWVKDGVVPELVDEQRVGASTEAMLIAYPIYLYLCITFEIKMATFVNRNAASYYRPQQYTTAQPVQVVPPRPAPDTRDDYERWYTESTPNNRMSLSLRSGILSEVAWALDRLCRLCLNEQFLFRTIPGVIDGLFDWPEWYVTEGYKSWAEENVLFSRPRELSHQRRYALESLFVIRNAALNETNAVDLAYHTHTMPLLLNAFFNLDPTRDENVEFILHVLDIFQVLAPRMHINASLAPRQNPLPPILNILRVSTNRSMIISALTAVTTLLSNPTNSPQITIDSPALAAAIRYLPLFMDIPLIDPCLDYLYIQISHPAHARAFLLHPEMPSVLKLLASFIVQEQALVVENVSLDVTGSVQTAASTATLTKDHELTQEELDKLLELTEPQRCYEWYANLLSSIEARFTPEFQDEVEKCALLVASDVIKNASHVFPSGQAMVLGQGLQQRFIVRGVDRKKDVTVVERFRCQWDRGQCSAPAFQAPGELYDHLLEHLVNLEGAEHPCLWSTCERTDLPKSYLRSHVLTHLSTSQPPQKHPSQSDTITLPSSGANYPTVDPTLRPIPPLRSTIIHYTRPKADPPSPALTALLILRILYRTSFASADAAPRADVDHFGFPGSIEDTSDPDDGSDANFSGEDKEGEMRGRKAFIGIRKFLENVNIYDSVLMSWVEEMADIGVTPITPDTDLDTLSFCHDDQLNTFTGMHTAAAPSPMNFPRRASLVTPKIVNLYSKLFKGIPPAQVKGPNQTQEQFYAELLTLELDRAFIVTQFNAASRDACLGPLKGFLKSWFKACMHWARSGSYDDVKKVHALETLSVIMRGIFAKSLSGWEIMEALAGSVNESDGIFTEFTNMVADSFSDPDAPAHIKHLVLQLALIYMCGAGQTSLGSYFLRRDLFPPLVSFIKNPETGKFTFEAILFLCVMANFHRSDAARLNPYLRRLSACDDAVFFEKVNWAVNFALYTAVQSYRNLSDDTPSQNLATGLVSLIGSWRPDKALSATPVDPPKELFKHQPIEAAVALLPMFELTSSNILFPPILAHSLSTVEGDKAERTKERLPPVLLTAISLASYILPHASSASSPRALAYANLSLKILLAFSESLSLLAILFEPNEYSVQLSRQFVHKHRAACVVVFAQYDWKPLWSATLGLLSFIASKAQSIPSSIELEGLIEEIVGLLELALSQSEKILPSTKALHEFIYELIRYSDGIQKLQVRSHEFAVPPTRTAWISNRTNEERLNNIMDTASFYEKKVSDAGARTAKDALRIVAQEIESEGLHGVKTTFDSEPPKRVEEAISFVRHGYSDILALMP
ncbi:hypothetical protein NP233_g5615 [Leucocoprinus birnbaumii]|uniref:Uncharacterized protein n=1 Tax=Leucocoprinus birnbaumii TaxID=56174 RepID=A0AAD5VV69_9AGAR|nr:hypothetical protein NP233_g5615 [Leucocoprinus birnbaumii]